MNTLATGATLTPETFADFVARLRHDVAGEGVKDHYTADAIFIVQARKQWSILDALPDHTVTGWDEKWEYVSAHMTKDAAEAFIQRKKHDYRKGLRVYVESQCYCWEYNTIIAALMSGELVLKGESK